MPNAKKRPIADFFILARDQPNVAFGWGVAVIVVLALVGFGVVKAVGGGSDASTAKSSKDAQVDGSGDGGSSGGDTAGDTTTTTPGRGTTTSSNGAASSTPTTVAAIDPSGGTGNGGNLPIGTLPPLSDRVGPLPS